MFERVIDDVLRVQHEDGAGGVCHVLEYLRRGGLHVSPQCTLQKGREVIFNWQWLKLID